MDAWKSEHHISIVGLYWSDQYRYRGVQYAVSASRATWFDARDSCIEDNATLAVVTSADVEQFLWDMCQIRENTYV